MRGEGFQQGENAASPQSRPAALVIVGLIATSFVLGALGTHLMLTGRRQPQEVSVPPVDVASVTASKEIAPKDTGRLETADRDTEPGASRPPVLPSGPPLPASLSLSTRRDGAVLAVESLLPASSPPRSPRSTSSAVEDTAVRFAVPVGGHVILPVKTSHVAPVYPYVARTARIEGVVVLEAVITAEGRVADVRIADSAPLLDEAALAAIRQWHYEPAQLNRMPVSLPVTISVTFSL